MGFWIFMLIMELLVPATLIGFGLALVRRPPGTINSVYGYRTPMSSKNMDTWNFAQRYCGKIWYISGRVLLIPTVLASLAVLGKDDDTVGNMGAILCTVQLIPMLGAIIPTELALRRKFDKNGNRKPE